MEDMRYLQLIANGGSFALLSAITLWVLRWLPARLESWDRRDQAERDHREILAERHREAMSQVVQAQQAQLERLAQAHLEGSARLAESLAEQMRYEREQCARQFEVLAEELRSQRGLLDRTVQLTSEAVVLLRQHHEQAQEAIRRLGESTAGGSRRGSH